jgi:peptidoglycan DL-endopeptidase CwlO
VGRHSLVRESRLRGPVRGALLAGAVAGSTAAMPAVPAMAQTLSIPGVGNIDIPDLPQNVRDAAASQQVQDAIKQIAPQAPQVAAAASAVVEQVAHPSAAPVAGPSFEIGATSGQRALDAARTQIGTPYVWGGQGPGGFDCSGLVKWSYAHAGVHMPRTSFEQAHVGAPVSLNDLRPGDVIIYNGGSHAALYAGNGRILQASTSGEPVKYSDMHSAGEIYTARRI